MADGAVKASEPESLCLRCRKEPISYMTLPCRHKTLCTGCAARVATGKSYTYNRGKRDLQNAVPSRRNTPHAAAANRTYLTGLPYVIAWLQKYDFTACSFPSTHATQTTAPGR